VLSSARLFVIVVSAMALVGCEKDERGSNARRATELPDEATGTSLMSTVYQYSGAEQALADLKRLSEAEKWPEAVGVAQAILAKEPEHAEAKRVLELAKLEGSAQLRVNEFSKRLAARDVGGAVRAFRQIPQDSRYRGQAQADYEKLRDNWVAATEADVRNAVRAGRCDDARRGARLTADLFPEGREAIEAIASTCRGRNEPEVAAKDKPKDKDEDVREAPRGKPVEVASLSTSASTSPAPPAPPAPPPAAPVAQPSPAPVTPAPAPKADFKPVPLAELEKLRTGGDAKPDLPTSVKQSMKRDQTKSVMIAAKLCVNETGSVASVTLMKASPYDEANAKIVSEIKKWRFKPYRSAGVPTPVCSAAMLKYEINL